MKSSLGDAIGMARAPLYVLPAVAILTVSLLETSCSHGEDQPSPELAVAIAMRCKLEAQQQPASVALQFPLGKWDRDMCRRVTSGELACTEYQFAFETASGGTGIPFRFGARGSGRWKGSFDGTTIGMVHVDYGYWDDLPWCGGSSKRSRSARSVEPLQTTTSSATEPSGPAALR